MRPPTVSHRDAAHAEVAKLRERLGGGEQVIVAGPPRHAHRHRHEQPVAQLEHDPRQRQQTIMALLLLWR